MGGGGAAISPEQIAIWEAEEPPPIETMRDKFNAVRDYFGAGWKAFLFGSYSYKFLCMPTFWPWKKGGQKPPPFFTVNEKLPLAIALVMGLQHALAMVGGLIVPPLLIGGQASMFPGVTEAEAADVTRDLINFALICSGIFTMIHCTQFPIYRTPLVYGSGILSCTGISFAFLSSTLSSISYLKEQNYTFDEAYGKCLGTLMVCVWIVVAMSFMPPRFIRRVFPPIVPGVVIFLIGTSLIGSAFYNWGGGSFCGENAAGLAPNVYTSCQYVNDVGVSVNGTCYGAATIPLCNSNGDVELVFGVPEYIGLGFAAFMILVLLELFGSPMMRNSQIIIALLLGYLIAGVVRHQGKSYVDTSNIKDAPGITFLWVKTFPIGFYAPAVLPYLVSFIILGVEVIGDVTATAEVSGIETAGPTHRRRIQGALLADGVNCFFGLLAMTLPSTTFAQNNGVINITRCSSRLAGVLCGCWLILLGVIAPIGAFFTSIPSCVLGGVTCFLFANVAVSGIKIIVLGDLQRRNRFILSMALAIGLGTTLVPAWSQNHLWPEKTTFSNGLRGFRDACIICLESGYTMGFIFTVLLNLLLPMEQQTSVDITDVKKGLYDPTAPRHKTVEGDEEFPTEKPVDYSPEVMYRDDSAAHGRAAEDLA